MRNRITKNGLEVSVVSGTYAALLSVRITDNAKVNKPDFLGFEIVRDDVTEKETYSLEGFKRFPGTPIPKTAGQLFTTHTQPIQSFFWQDFTVKPAHKYAYEIIPVYGKPKKLTYGDSATISFTSEPAEGEKHSVHFNMGVAGSLAYARDFGNKAPDKMTAADRKRAVTWLSRGLQEALLGFIDKAIAGKLGIRAAFYEFTYAVVLDKLQEAIEKGCDVQIVYDSRAEEDENDTSIAAAHISKASVTARKNDPQVPSHNKFMILMDGVKPTEVWTGSVNITDKGVLGHSNVAHVIKDADIAASYLAYWKKLQTDPALQDFKDTTTTIQPDIATVAGFNKDATVFFSPRNEKTILSTYAAFIDSAKDMVCGIFPFSFSKEMKLSLGKKTDHLKYILVDKISNAKGIVNKDKFTWEVNGAYFAKGIFEWLEEVNAGVLLNKNHNPIIGTNYVHNKIVLIDPLGKSPVIIVGSANFSEPSISTNDENTLVIKGGAEIKRIADIYFTEFYRLFHHFFVRMATLDMNKGKDATAGSANDPLILKTDNTWVAKFNTDESKVKLQTLLSNMPLA